MGGTFLSYLTLMCWSWAGGFAIGSLSRRTNWVNGALFCFVLFGELLAVPQQHNPFNPLVFSLTFYRVLFPLLLRIVLVLLPLFWGVRKGLRLAILPPIQATLAATAIAIMTGLAAGT